MIRRFKLSFRDRSLVVTSLGLQFLGLMMVVGIAAVNTGNNLLYLILAMMLSMVVISGILSESCVNRIEFRRVMPEWVTAGRPVEIGIQLKNRKRMAPSFSLHIQDRLEGLPEDLGREIYFFKLAAGKPVERSYSLCFPKRGVFSFQGVTFSTRFPFGFFIKFRREKETSGTRIIVFPRTFNVSFIERREEREGVPNLLRKGQGFSLYGFRPYSPGDDARTIHWKISAKRNKLIVRESELENEKKAVIYLSDCSFGPPSGESSERFEKGIELAASFAKHFIDRGYEVGLETDLRHLPAGSGKAQLKEILTFLSEVQAVSGEPALKKERFSTPPSVVISPFRSVGSGWPGGKALFFDPGDIDRGHARIAI
ncbi:MAG TPA: DUF58 domain-containing protein [Nitrospiria bacterium]|nr:DUF58 domain-containing protein [Nitrospiria bacterium]